MEVEWVTPIFMEAESEADMDSTPVITPAAAAIVKAHDNPASLVDWMKPRLEDIDHQDHRRVHVTLMAGHLDIAAGYNRNGDGVGVKQHVAAASAHNKAAGLHIKADRDVDYIEPAVKASRDAYGKSRRLIRRVKKANMVPEALQSTPLAQAAVAEVKSLKADLAPEALAERQWRRQVGKDLALL